MEGCLSRPENTWTHWSVYSCNRVYVLLIMPKTRDMFKILVLNIHVVYLLPFVSLISVLPLF